MPCRTCRRIRSAVNTAAKALRLGQHQPKVKPSGKVYDRLRVKHVERTERENRYRLTIGDDGLRPDWHVVVVATPNARGYYDDGEAS